MIKKILWSLFAFLCVLVAFYPIPYYLLGSKFGVLTMKSEALLASVLYNIGFYTHITFGGIALLVGWTQFSRPWRNKYQNLHRTVGKTYVSAALAGGAAGLVIALNATGGPIAIVGFVTLGVLWVYTTLRAYTAIRKGRVAEHERFMVLSYAACFGAVTLRLWMPILIPLFDGAFLPAYRTVAWLAWAPNLLVALWWNRRKRIQAFNVQ